MAEAVMHCHTCGHQPPPDSLFCNQCGTRLVHGEAEVAAAQHSYTPRHLVEKVLTMRSALEGERKQVTVLFVDVKGSVALSEQVNAEVWHQLMDQFFSLLSEGIHAHEGTINQYTGEGVMALFGAPIAHEDHARRACLTALHLQSRLHQWAQELLEEYGIDFKVRMGLNSGEVVVGRIGDDLRMDYTARGHTVGLAARMESMAKPGRIYLSQFTATLIKREFELKDRGDLRIKGVSHRVKLYELRRTVPRSSARFKAAEDRISPLVGREPEFELLHTALIEAQDGAGQVVCISGAPGLGKSRLCHEFAEHCREQQIPVYETRGVSHFKAAPLAPFEELVRSYFGLLEDDDLDSLYEKITARLNTLDPKLVNQVDLLVDLVCPAAEGHTGMEDTGRLAKLIELSNEMIRAGALDESGVVIVENIQWLDDEPSMQAFVNGLIHAVAKKNILVVVTMRPEHRPNWQDLPHVRVVELKGLAEPVALGLLDRLMGEDKSLKALKSLIVQRSGGNPLFMEEILGSLLDEGKLERGRDGMRLKTPVESLGLPAEVQVVVAARMDRLNDNDKHVLQVASVIGKRFAQELLQVVTQLKESELQQSLERLAQTGWIYVFRAEEPVQYAFHQSLVRDVAYHSQLSENRALIHEAIAEHLCSTEQANDGVGMALIAQHYAGAGEWQAAADWRARAAHWYGPRSLEAAMRQWQRLLEVVEEMESGPQRCRTGLQAHARLLHLGSYHGISEDRADVLMSAGADLAERCEDAKLRAYFLLACGAVLQSRGELADGIARLEQAEAEGERLQDPGVRAAVRTAYVHSLLNCGRIEDALQHAIEGQDWLQEDIEIGTELLGRSPLISLTLYQAQAMILLGEFEPALGRIETAMGWAQQREETLALSLANILLSLLMGERGHPRKALTYARQAHQLSERSSNRVLQFMSTLALARAGLVAGNLGRAQQWLDDGLARLRKGQVARHEEPRFLLLQARVLAAEENYDAARKRLREAIKLARKVGTPHIEADAQLVGAEISLAQGNSNAGSEARDFLKKAEQLIEQTQAHYLMPRWHLAQADLAEMGSDTQLTQQAIESAAEWLEQVGARLKLKKLKTRQSQDKSGKLDTK